MKKLQSFQALPNMMHPAQHQAAAGLMILELKKRSSALPFPWEYATVGHRMVDA
jgi:hypothetical protein